MEGSENVRPQSIPETQDWTELGSEDPNAAEETDLIIAGRTPQMGLLQVQ